MGITFTKVKLSNPRRWRAGSVELDFLVDTGAIYSVVPSRVLKKLGITRMEREQFILADGTKQEYAVGEAFFELERKAGTSKVVFAPAGTTPLLGALALESLGLMVNPVTRELKPMRLILAAGTGPRGPAAAESISVSHHELHPRAEGEAATEPIGWTMKPCA